MLEKKDGNFENSIDTSFQNKILKLVLCGLILEKIKIVGDLVIEQVLYKMKHIYF